MWREESTRSDLERLATALATLPSDRQIHRAFWIKRATTPPPARVRVILQSAKTQPIPRFQLRL